MKVEIVRKIIFVIWIVISIPLFIILLFSFDTVPQLHTTPLWFHIYIGTWIIVAIIAWIFELIISYIKKCEK